MSVAQRSVAGVVAAIAVVVLIVAVLTVAGGDREVATGSPSPTPSASPSEPEPTSTASAEPSPTGPTGDEAVAILTEIEAQVEAIRGLPPADIGAPDLITRAELAVELRELFDEEYPPEERERDNVALRAFGLLDPDQDVAELQLQMLGEGVLGFYDEKERRMVVVSDSGLDAVAKLTYAHEYTHALQDAAFGIDSLERDAVGEDDRGLARTALLEGDANAAMLAWAFRHMTQAEILELQEMELPDNLGIPSWMVAQQEFPYTVGLSWVTAIAGGDPLQPDFAAVDAAYADPPDSTEQVIDVAKWHAREAPIAVEVPDLAAGLGAGWEHVDTSPVGQATIAIILEYFGADGPDADIAADGWGGDRATVAQGPNGEFALAWRLAWDGPEDAEEFIHVYGIGQALEPFAFPASARLLADGQVLVVHASTQAVHDAVVGLAGG